MRQKNFQKQICNLVNILRVDAFNNNSKLVDSFRNSNLHGNINNRVVFIALEEITLCY